jgi:hypothetical protein
MKALLAALVLLLAPVAALAATCPTYPYTLTNGTTADADQVMANFNAILNCVNNNVPILTTPINISIGGTGATTAAGAAANLGVLQASNNLSDVASTTTAVTNLGALLAANNLSDVASTTTALINLGGLAKTSNLSDVSSASTALANLGGAPLASPTFTGTPAAPTATAGTSTTQIATTAFVTAGRVIPYAVFTDQQTNGTASGESITATTWTQMGLNTSVVNTISGASLGSNQVTLPAGTYQYAATGTAYQTTGSASFMNIRLRNATASTTIGVSEAQTVSRAVTNANAQVTLTGVFVLSGSTVLEIDRYVGVTATGGVASSNGEPEVYGRLTLEKIG